MKTRKINADGMRIIHSKGYNYVVRPVARRSEKIEDPNWMGLHVALTGVLQHGDTLSNFKQRWIIGQQRIYESKK